MLSRRVGLAAALTAVSYSRLSGANERIRIAFIGCGSRAGGALLPSTLDQPGVEVVAACDVYRPNLDKALTAIGTKGGRAESFTDYRKVIERKDIDAIFVATPDHWHAPITVAACAAGKDVYVEKPLANGIEDCFAIVDAAAKYKRIVQVGVQQRSMQIYFDALALLRDIGTPRRCVMQWASGGPARFPDSEGPVPDGLDWEMFQGPAARQTYRPARQRSWRSYWEYGSGAIADLGVHLLDVTHWFAGIDNPQICYGAGYHSSGRPAEQVPDNVALTWKYPSFLATFGTERTPMGNTFYGDTGTLFVSRSMLALRNFESREVKEQKATRPDRAIEHITNFLDCVRTRKQPNADPVTLAKSTIPCLLSARAVRTGKAYRLDWDRRVAVEV